MTRPRLRLTWLGTWPGRGLAPATWPDPLGRQPGATTGTGTCSSTMRTSTRSHGALPGAVPSVCPACVGSRGGGRARARLPHRRVHRPCSSNSSAPRAATGQAETPWIRCTAPQSSSRPTACCVAGLGEQPRSRASRTLGHSPNPAPSTRRLASHLLATAWLAERRVHAAHPAVPDHVRLSSCHPCPCIELRLSNVHQRGPAVAGHRPHRPHPPPSASVTRQGPCLRPVRPLRTQPGAVPHVWHLGPSSWPGLCAPATTDQCV